MTSTPAEGAAASTTHNPIFAQLVDLEDPSVVDVQGLVAYGLYKKAKQEWAQGIWERHQRHPTEAELHGYISTWTPTNIALVQEQSRAAFVQAGEYFVEIAKPGIREEAIRGTFWSRVAETIVANGIYTIVLIAFALILKHAGFDIGSIFKSVANDPAASAIVSTPPKNP